MQEIRPFEKRHEQDLRKSHHPRGAPMKAEKFIDGIPVNPVLPKNFSDTPNEERPASHEIWWDRPYIQTTTVEELDAEYANRTDDYAEEARRAWVGGRLTWMKAWPSGTRYAVRCLDGGAWDRPTCWGMFGTLEDALVCAKNGPAWRGGASMAEELIAERRAEAGREP